MSAAGALATGQHPPPKSVGQPEKESVNYQCPGQLRLLGCTQLGQIAHPKRLDADAVPRALDDP
ncbi:MAG: hypothetical protein QOK45_1195 [Mycobacterium sp.]|jgi:hypothetical protein|nr:hypothetical protein [Mycobacterium sp.]